MGGHKSPGVIGTLVAIPLQPRILGQGRREQAGLCKNSTNDTNSLHFRDTKEIY